MLVGMHIHIVPNRGSPPTVLLRESYRDGRKVGKRTLANLSSLSAAQIEAIRAALRGEAWQPIAQTFAVVASPAHGAVHAVDLAMQRLGFAALVASKSSRERDLVMASGKCDRLPRVSFLTTPSSRKLRRSRCVR